MPGFSITLLLLPTGDEVVAATSKELLSLLDAPCNVPGWRWSAPQAPVPPSERTQVSKGNIHNVTPTPVVAASNAKLFDACVQAACGALISNEPEITRLDSVAGDGDCGLTLRSGAQG